MLGLPFLVHDSAAYIGRAFEFSRKFLYIWTVNWRFVPEEVFQSRSFATTLLACHAALLVVALSRWTSRFGGIAKFIQRCAFDIRRPAAISPTQVTPSCTYRCARRSEQALMCLASHHRLHVLRKCHWHAVRQIAALSVLLLGSTSIGLPDVDCADPNTSEVSKHQKGPADC